MPGIPGFADSFMPAGQRTGFAASQRFVVQPGSEQDAILTIAGGQAGHPLCTFIVRVLMGMLRLKTPLYHPEK